MSILSYYTCSIVFFLADIDDNGILQAKKNKGMNKKLDKMKRQNSKSMETKYLEDEDRTQEAEVGESSCRYTTITALY